jgi:transcription antitermination factor NusG
MQASSAARQRVCEAGLERQAERTNSLGSAPEGASDGEELTVSLKRYPDTNRGLSAASMAAAELATAHWFAAYTSSHHEKRAAAQLAERGMESFLPLYAALRRWRNRCAVTLELPLFSNYVFVRMAWRERVRVLEVPGVLSLVGFGRTLSPLPDFEIEALRAGLRQRKTEPHPYLVVGERVRIVRGAMLGMEGVLLRRKNSLRVVLALEAILRSVAVEVDADDVEPAAKTLIPVVVRSGLPSDSFGQSGWFVRPHPAL